MDQPSPLVPQPSPEALYPAALTNERTFEATMAKTKRPNFHIKIPEPVRSEDGFRGNQDSETHEEFSGSLSEYRQKLGLVTKELARMSVPRFELKQGLPSQQVKGANPKPVWYHLEYPPWLFDISLPAVPDRVLNSDKVDNKARGFFHASNGASVSSNANITDRTKALASDDDYDDEEQGAIEDEVLETGRVATETDC